MTRRLGAVVVQCVLLIYVGGCCDDTEPVVKTCPDAGVLKCKDTGPGTCPDAGVPMDQGTKPDGPFKYLPVTYVWKNVTPPTVLVDDYMATDTHRDWYYSRIGTDRGKMGGQPSGGAPQYSVAFGGGSAKVAVLKNCAQYHCWGGVWTTLIHRAADKHSLDLGNLLGPHVEKKHQVSGIKAVAMITDGKGTFKMEWKNLAGTALANTSKILTGGKTTVELAVPATKLLHQLTWSIEGIGATVTVDKVLLTVAKNQASPSFTSAEAAFLYSYGHLSQAYDPLLGVVRDRARWPAEAFTAMQSTCMFGLVTAVAAEQKYVPKTTAVQIVKKIADTVLNKFPNHKGLYPHFLYYQGGKWLAIPEKTIEGVTYDASEYSSVDTVLCHLSMILATEGLGLTAEKATFEKLLNTPATWSGLIVKNANGKNCLSHGYNGKKILLNSCWDTWGAETLLMAVAYAAAGGDLTQNFDLVYPKAPTWDGSGFNDEMGALFFPMDGADRWGNHWPTYRKWASHKQISVTKNWYTPQSIFGISASEVPEPWKLKDGKKIYSAWGVGGHNKHFNDGYGLVGHPIFAPHYAAMIMAENPKVSEEMLLYLMNTQSRFTPLNNVESFGLASDKTFRFNALKGSWNLVLQALGAARALAGTGYGPHAWSKSNNLLSTAYKKVMK